MNDESKITYGHNFYHWADYTHDNHNRNVLNVNYHLAKTKRMYLLQYFRKIISMLFLLNYTF